MEPEAIVIIFVLIAFIAGIVVGVSLTRPNISR
jgi:uncharacterized protein YneF (UPF0154 family)